MKWEMEKTVAKMALVAPLAGAWIEIDTANDVKRAAIVAPLAGAWIEIVL